MYSSQGQRSYARSLLINRCRPCLKGTTFADMCMINLLSQPKSKEISENLIEKSETLLSSGAGEEPCSAAAVMHKTSGSYWESDNYDANLIAG
jgi:hypothetical protein